MSTRARAVLSVGGALLFGLAAGALHGNDGGLRGALGNLSAPWLLVALVPAWFAGSTLRGLVLGTVATLVALVGFYAALTATMYGHLGEVTGAGPSFRFVLAANRIWFVAGIMSGPLCGLLAGFLGTRVRRVWLAVLAGALMVAEIAIVTALPGAYVPVLDIHWATTDLRGYAAQAALGGLLLLAAASRARRNAGSPPT